MADNNIPARAMAPASLSRAALNVQLGLARSEKVAAEQNLKDLNEAIDEMKKAALKSEEKHEANMAKLRREVIRLTDDVKAVKKDSESHLGMRNHLINEYEKLEAEHKKLKGLHLAFLKKNRPALSRSAPTTTYDLPPITPLPPRTTTTTSTGTQTRVILPARRLRQPVTSTGTQTSMETSSIATQTAPLEPEKPGRQLLSRLMTPVTTIQLAPVERERRSLKRLTKPITTIKMAPVEPTIEPIVITEVVQVEVKIPTYHAFTFLGHPIPMNKTTLFITLFLVLVAAYNYWNYATLADAADALFAGNQLTRSWVVMARNKGMAHINGTWFVELLAIIFGVGDVDHVIGSLDRAFGFTRGFAG